MSTDLWLHVTAGKGPEECAWAVVEIVERILAEAKAAGLEARAVEMEHGTRSGTANSALLSVSGDSASAFAPTWRGTVQWIARSPFRPEHKRKNWFVGVEVLSPTEATQFDTADVRWETMRASGPGGQHVNRTESAVRVTPLPTGVQATAAEERSQHRNRKLALARLAAKLNELDSARKRETQEKRWRAHQELERGNPVRIIRP